MTDALEDVAHNMPSVVIFHKDQPFSPNGIHSGAEMGTIHLARALTRRGAQVTVVGRITSGGGDYDGVHYLDLGPHYNIRAGLAQLEAEVDVLISVTRADVLEAALAFPNIRRRVLWMQDSDPALTRLGIPQINACADVLVYVAQALRQVLEKHGLARAKGVVIHNGFDGAVFAPRPVAVAPDRLTFVGALVPEKGVKLLVEAFNILSLKRPQAELWLYGSETLWGYKASWDKELIEFNNPRIHFAGSVSQSQLAELFSRSALNVIPSLPSKRFDPFPLTSIEAQACGCPVMVSTCGGLPEGVVDGKTGFIFPGEDPVTLAQWLEDALADRARLAQMRQLAVEHVRANFTWDAIAQQFLDAAFTLAPATPSAAVASQAVSGPKDILALYQHAPEFDRKGGDIRAYRLLRALALAGHHVTLVARDTQPTPAETERYRRAYEELGIEVHHLEQVRQFGDESQRLPLTSLETLLKGRHFDAAWISWWNIADQFLARLRNLFPATRMVVDSVDVAYLRFLREAALYENADLWVQANEMRRVELKAYRQADEVLAVTDDDKQVLQQVIPGLPVTVVPLVHATADNPAGFMARRDLIFVGYFEHLPNTDAALYFAREIFPLVQRRLPDVKLYLVGYAPPAEVSALASKSVIVTGYVPDLAPYWQGARVALAPLRFGAGMKTKIGQAMAEGLPTVTTTIGAEGMDLRDGEDALIADTPEAFAEAVVRLYTDAALWQKLSENGRQIVRARWSDDVVRDLLLGALFDPQPEPPDGDQAASKSVQEAKNLALVAQGYSWWQQNFLASAEATFRQSIEGSPNCASGYLGLMLLAYQRQDYQQAWEWMRYAQELAPDNPGVHTGLGLLLCQQGQYAQAQAELERAFKQYAHNSRTLNGLAEVAQASGDAAMALDYYWRCLKIRDYDRQALLGCSKLMLGFGQKKTAWPLLLEAYHQAQSNNDAPMAVEAQALLVKLADELTSTPVESASAQAGHGKRPAHLKKHAGPISQLPPKNNDLPAAHLKIEPAVKAPAGSALRTTAQPSLAAAAESAVSPHAQSAPPQAMVDIVVPIYGQAALVRRCVESVLATTGAHLTLVDDWSPGNDIADLFAEWQGHPRLTLARTPSNQGFIGACRYGAGLGKSPFILFLNSDTEAFERGWLEKLVPAEDDIAIVGAKLLYPSNVRGPLAGTIQHAGVARNADGIPYHPFLGWPAQTPEANTPHDVNAVTGACFLVRRKVWDELGGWDARFGKGVYEDVDLCWQARKQGYRVLYQPAVCLYHNESASTAKDGGHALNAHTQENRQKLLEKWHPLSSDETLFVGDKTVRRWERARKQIKRAQAAVNQHNPKAAFAAMSKAVEIAADLPEAQVGCAQLLAVQEDHAAAAAHFGQAVKLLPTAWDLRLQVVDEWLKARQPEKAAAELLVLREVFPNAPEVKQREAALKPYLPADAESVFQNPKAQDQNPKSEIPNPKSVETLEMLFAQPDLLAALQANEDKLDDDLLALVRVNANTARTDGKLDLAQGLDNLAAYVEQVIQNRKRALENPKALETLRLLLEADDLPAALEQHAGRLDTDLLALVRAHAKQVRADGDAELAEGLDNLAAYVEQKLTAKTPPAVSAQAVETLERLFAQPDLLAALQANEEKLDANLLALVRLNANTARADGKPELAQGLDNLAAYIEQVVQGRAAQPARFTAAETLEMLLNAPDVAVALEQNLDRLDDDLAALVRQNAASARQEGQAELADELESFAEHITQIIQSRNAHVPNPDSPRAAETLAWLLEAEDLPAAVEQHKARLDDDLLAVVRANAATARADGQPDLAEGLEALADYVRQAMDGR